MPRMGLAYPTLNHSRPARMQLKRIALFGRKNTSYDYFMLSGLATGFRAAGMEVVFHPRLLDADTMTAFCAQYRPDAVFEINRMRQHAPGLPAGVRHIAWLQDPPVPERSDAQRCDSELTYFLTCPDTLGYELPAAQPWHLLFTGVDPRTAHPSGSRAASDFSVIAYIPSPWRDQALAWRKCGPGQVPMLEVFEAFTARYWSSYTRSDAPPLQFDAYVEMFSQTLLELGGITLEEFAPGAAEQGEIAETVVQICRSIGRRKMTDAVLRVSASVRIFGQRNWLKWPQYAPYYQGSLDRHGDVCEAFRTTRLNLHNSISGLSMHSRVLDCMACGAPILVEASHYDDLSCGINRFFEPEVHYIPFRFDTLEDTARRWLEDEPARRRLGAEAARVTQAHHTWQARARQIAADFEAL